MPVLATLPLPYNIGRGIIYSPVLEIALTTVLHLDDDVLARIRRKEIRISLLTSCPKMRLNPMSVKGFMNLAMTGR